MQYHAINRYPPIKVVFIALMGVLTAVRGCNPNPYPRMAANDLTGTKLIVNYPLVQGQSGQLHNLPDTIPIFYCNDYTLYSLPYRQTFEKNGQLIREEIKYTWFIYKANNKWGYLFNSLDDSNQGRALQVDSLLFKRAYAMKFDPAPDSLVEISIDKKNNIVLEKYIPRKFYGDAYFDSSYYYYTSSLNHLKYSFSHKLDSSKGMKLYKIRLLYNEKFSAANNFVVPTREFLFEIKEAPIVNATEITLFFEKIKKYFEAP